VDDDFGLLCRLGHDCAGAVTFDDPGSPSLSDGYTPLPEATLRRWLEDPFARPSPDRAPGLRRTLAGAQDKLILHLAESEAYLCEGGAPSTVILKPDIQNGFRGVELTALNELFCMQLAAAVGLRVARAFWFAGAVTVERFDRRLVGSRLERVHQEDFAQLAGILPRAKYDLGTRDCFAVIDRFAADRAASRREFVERLLFNLLIGNGDAHAKNFGLLFGHGGAVLAPAYDLLCTEVYPALSQVFVMKIGPARRQSELSLDAWDALAHEADLPLQWIQERGAELSSGVQIALRDLPLHLFAQNPTLLADISPARRRDDFLRKLVDHVTGNCKRVVRSLARAR
jgi:serine/threonine-protein kinase HipA